MARSRLSRAAPGLLLGVGLGLGYSHADGVGSICSLTAVTPVDDERSVLRFSTWASKEDGRGRISVAKRQRNAIGQV
ncbi:hypothetical protein GS532_30715, partial [Rhodococcus hoagii]|nr:hypothetical protein [Prescottella equi]